MYPKPPKEGKTKRLPTLQPVTLDLYIERETCCLNMFISLS